MPVAEEKEAVLNRYGRRELIRTFIRIIVGLAVLLLSAGTIRWVNAWVFSLVNALIVFAYGRVLARLNPQMLNARGKCQKGTKRFDKVILGLWIPTSFAGLIVAGLDAVRYGWSVMPSWLNALGLLLYIGGVLLSVTAMAVNKHFETTVRIQHDRGHRVCSEGPYRFVRHPGYSGFLVSSIAGPLVLGSWYALIPNAMIIALFVIRTALEDRTLRLQLPGYTDYAQKTRYRLVPKVW